LKAHAGIRLKTQLGLMNEWLEMGLASLFSIIFVAGIWFSITRGLDILDSFEVPIEYMNRQADQRIVDTSVNSLKIRLGGTRSLMRSIRPNQLRVTVNLSDAVIGKNAFTITQDDITLPAGVILKDINPENVEVTLDVLTEKALTIQADWVGKPADNLMITAAKLTPSEIVIIGTKQMLESLSTVYTQKTPIDEIKGSGTVMVGLAFNPARFKIKSGSVNKVRIDYTVAERSEP
jgi:YbbR domain-containing protein